MSTDASVTTTSSGNGSVDREKIDELMRFAIDALPTLRLPNGVYCFDKSFGATELHGESARYSLMVHLGLSSATAAGLPVNEDLDALFHRCLHHPDLTAGDLGLLLWCASRRDGGDVADLVRRLEGAIAADATLGALAGMEIGWILLGLAHLEDAEYGTDESRAQLARVLAHLRTTRSTRSAMFMHYGDGRRRANFPNFATQIYTLMALTTIAGHDLDANARREAIALADVLLGHQRANGGWPWLYHAPSGAVVEAYEIYSVHQDGMAPMALLPLSELTGDPRDRDAAHRGLRWGFENNELGIDFYDKAARFVHRSIRRAGLRARAALALNTVSASAFKRSWIGEIGARELNRTCRPYHLGWILEAWAANGQVES